MAATEILERPREAIVTEQPTPSWTDWRETEVRDRREKAEKDARKLGRLVQERVLQILELAGDPRNDYGYKHYTSFDGTFDEVRLNGQVIAQRTTDLNSDPVYILSTYDERPDINGFPAVRTDGRQTDVIYFPRTDSLKTTINARKVSGLPSVVKYLPEPRKPIKRLSDFRM